MLRRCPNKKTGKERSNTSDKDPPDKVKKGKSDKLTRDKFGLLTKVGGWKPKNECDKQVDENCGYCNREHELKDCKPYEVHLSKGFIDEQGNPTELFNEQLENERVDEWGFTVKQQKMDSFDPAPSADTDHGEHRVQHDGEQPAPQPSQSIGNGGSASIDNIENGGSVSQADAEAWSNGDDDDEDGSYRQPPKGSPMSQSSHQIL